MDNKISVIPEIGEINRYARLAVQYDLSFEYNDFYRPGVYDDPDEISRRRLDTEEYCKSWLRDAKEFLSGLAASNPEITVFLENTFEKTPDILVDFMESVSDVPNLRICLDYAHACLVTDRTEEWFSELAKYIGHIHINDNDLRSDLHLSLGDGKIDLVRLKSLLDRYKPDCNILLEVSGYDRTVKSLEKIRSL